MLASASLARRGTGDPGHPLVGEAREGLSSGSTPIVGAFFEHEQGLKNYVSRFMPRAADIDDLVQEVFVRAYDAERKRPVYAPTAFLFRVARNLSLKEIRRRATYRSTSLPAHSLDNDLAECAFAERLHTEISIEDQLDGRAKLIAFCRVAGRLPRKCRRAFLLRKFDGFSYQEIANELGISVRTAEKHVAAGVQRCGEYLHSVGMT